ncbi:MAG: hypothetical protein II067_04010, partial [Agathobacter sp.]|uniref:CHASE3 domain-containing protein n=1 Tax=Agathobacter sp. TaxID=2021311 RepID=UPI002ED136D7|nr:hypothetical protein [Agathobacter sp.]
MRKLIRKLQQQSLRRKLILLFSFFALVILSVNTLIFSRFGRMLNQLGGVYESNRQLNELDSVITDLQASIDEYVSTRSFDSLESYYDNEQNLRNHAETLNNEASDNALLLAEKNINGLCHSYLNLAEQTVDAKRGR